MPFFYVAIAIIGLLILFIILARIGFISYILYPPLRKKEAGFQYVYFEDDGSVRELNEDEKDYLSKEFHPNDGARPYIKLRHNDKTPDGKISGFMRRNRVPQNILIKKLDENHRF